MDLINYQQLLEQQVQQAVNKELNKILESLQKQIVSIQLQLRQEIFQSFKFITGIIIEQEFVKMYGQGFDLDSLQKSLIYVPSSNSLDFNIDYNPNVFRFNDKFMKDKNKFNQNAVNWERKNRKYLNPSFYTDSGSFSDFYENSVFDDYLDNDYTDEDDDDYMDELLMDYDNMTFNSKRNPYQKVDLTNVYNKAIQKAQFTFNQEWQRSLKNRLEKKYGIKLTD